MELFNSPFEIGKNKGKIQIDSIDTLTELCFVPITMAYISWLVKRLKGKAGSVVLFVSRDGYLLERLYKNIRLKNPGLELPDSVYFYASRKAMSEAIPKEDSDIEVLCANLDQYRKTEWIFLSKETLIPAIWKPVFRMPETVLILLG